MNALEPQPFRHGLVAFEAPGTWRDDSVVRVARLPGPHPPNLLLAPLPWREGEELIELGRRDLRRFRRSCRSMELGPEQELRHPGWSEVVRLECCMVGEDQVPLRQGQVLLRRGEQAWRLYTTATEADWSGCQEVFAAAVATLSLADPGQPESEEEPAAEDPELWQRRPRSAQPLPELRPFYHGALRLGIPADWVDDSLVRIMRPRTGAAATRPGGAPEPNLVLTRDRLRPGEELEEYGARSLKLMSRVLPQFRLLERGLTDHPAWPRVYLQRYSWTDPDGTRLVQRQVVIPLDRKLNVLWAACPKEEYQELLPCFDRAVESFQLIPYRPVPRWPVQLRPSRKLASPPAPPEPPATQEPATEPPAPVTPPPEPPEPPEPEPV